MDIPSASRDAASVHRENNVNRVDGDINGDGVEIEIRTLQSSAVPTGRSALVPTPGAWVQSELHPALQRRVFSARRA